MMRLIDADALKSVMIETLESLKRNPKMDLQEIHLICAFHTVGMMVDDAPTVNIDWTKHETTTGDSKSVTVNPAYPLGGSGNYRCSNTVDANHIADDGKKVDAVQVVRCKDCRYYAADKDRPPRGKCLPLNILSVDDWYCADGERREDDGND